MPSKPLPRDIKLYTKVKRHIYLKHPTHSAYRSGLLVKMYKHKFKTKYGPNIVPYIGQSSNRSGLKRWFQEKWRNSRGQVGYKYKSDVYRPTKRITNKTPVTYQELSKRRLETARKHKSRYGRVNRF